MAVVTAPMVLIRDSTGKDHYFTQGSQIPSGLNDARVKELVKEGYLSGDGELEVDVPTSRSTVDEVRAYVIATGLAAEDEAKALKKPELLALIKGEQGEQGEPPADPPPADSTPEA